MWPALLGNVALAGTFAAADYLGQKKGKRNLRMSIIRSALPTAGFMIQDALQPKWEEWVEPTRVAGFNPRTWGMNSEVDVYAVGRRKNTGWSKTR